MRLAALAALVLASGFAVPLVALRLVWDLFVQPGNVLGDVAQRLTSTRMVGMTLVTATFLTLAYGMLYVFLQAALDERAEQRDAS